MASKRLARLNEQLKRELAELIRSEVRDPRVGMVSVTGVQVAADLGSARVFIRALGGDAERAECLEGVQAAAPFLRRELGKILHIRKIPELRFQEDRSMEHAQRIEEILHQVLPEGHLQPDEVPGVPADPDDDDGWDDDDPGDDLDEDLDEDPDDDLDDDREAGA